MVEPRKSKRTYVQVPLLSNICDINSEDDHIKCVLKYALRWKWRAFKKTKATFELGSWVNEIFMTSCSESRRFELLDLLMGLLPSTLAASESANDYFELLFKMIDSEDARLFLTVRGCLFTICKLITQQAGNIDQSSGRNNISQGFILNKLIELLCKFLDVPNIRSRFMKDNLLSYVLEALIVIRVIVIRDLIMQNTKLISDSNQLLKGLLDGLLVGSIENKRQFIKACINGLQIHGEAKKGRTCLFILEQLCNSICPSKRSYLLVLNKAHTQEEFIEGSMMENPYSSDEIGLLMRDVKNKVVRRLGLAGLLGDDRTMELLVAGNIISLDLSIAQVYEQVWKKSNGQSSIAPSNSYRNCPPMVVTYRIQGLNVQASEPMIKELKKDREELQDPEIDFALAEAVHSYGRIDMWLGMIQTSQRDDFMSHQEQLVAVVDFLMHCCKIRENRRALLRIGAFELLVETAWRALSVGAMESDERIMLLVECLAIEANESGIISEETRTGEQAKKIVLMFLEILCLEKSNQKQIVERLARYLTYGGPGPSAVEVLIEHFNPYLHDWSVFDDLQKQRLDNAKDESISQQAQKQMFTIEIFATLSESLETISYGGEQLMDIIFDKGITNVAIRHLRDSFAIVGQAGYKSSTEWALGLKLPSIPVILSMLRGLSSMGHLPTQKSIDDGEILPILHALERVYDNNGIGARAEYLLDTLSNKGDVFLKDKVRMLRDATRDEERRRASRKREELLQGLGMRREVSSEGFEQIVATQHSLDGLDYVREEVEDGLTCIVCREGYSLRPRDLLGVYAYSTFQAPPVELGLGDRGLYMTISYFNCIHFECHEKAKKRDAYMMYPKKEWEGATRRNMESPCNALFPVRAQSVPLEQYFCYVDKYWNNLNALGRGDGTRFFLLMFDIRMLFIRLGSGDVGGEREGNSRFLLFMIQMAHHILDPFQRCKMDEDISKYISFGSVKTGTMYMMLNSLLSQSHKSWLKHRRIFLKRAICEEYLNHHTADSDLLSVIRSSLVKFVLIEQLQRMLKSRRSKGQRRFKSGGSKCWVVRMTKRLTNVKEMLGFSKELLLCLEKIESASDLKQAFDIVGVSDCSDVSRSEEFVRAAINAEKSRIKHEKFWDYTARNFF